MKHLIIIGTGAFARELYGHAKNSIGYGTSWDIKGYIDGDVKSPKEEVAKLKLPVLGDINNYVIHEDDVFTCAIATPVVRKRIIEFMLDKGAVFQSIIHNTCQIQEDAIIGKGVVLSPFCGINSCAKISDYVIMNMYCDAGHDAEIGEYTCMMGHVDITGFVNVGTCAYFGSGARVLPHGKIGNNAYIGAGSVVLKKVKDSDKVFGIPAISIL